MKQPGFFFGAFGALLLILRRREESPKTPLIKALSAYTAGFVFPYAAVCFTFYEAGVWGQFWFWTHKYASIYASRLDFNTGRWLFKYNFGLICHYYTFLWICAGLGAVFVFLKREYREYWIFFETFLIFSFLALSAGLYFRRHYFVLLLPASSLLIGVAVRNFHKILSKIIGKPTISACMAVGLFIAISVDPFVRQYVQFKTSSFERVSRLIYGTNPFPESIRIAEYINSHTSPNDKIAVIGSEPQIYFYAKRPSATSHIYMYPLMETHKYAGTMQSELINQIEDARPKYVVYVDIPTSWLVTPDSEVLIFDWAKRYLRENYTKAMIVEVRMDGDSRYLRGQAAEEQPLPADRTIELLELRQ